MVRRYRLELSKPIFWGAESSFKEGFESCEWHKCTHVNIVYCLFQRSVRKKYNTKTFLSLLNR